MQFENQSRRAFVSISLLTMAASARSSGVSGASLRGAVPTIEPYGFAESQPPRGVYADCMRELSGLSGLPIEAQLLPLWRSVQSVNQGLCDFTFLLPNAGFVPETRSLGVLGPIDVYLLPRKGYAVSALNELKGMRLAQLRGAARWGGLPDSVSRVEVPSGRAMVGMAHLDRVDAAFAPLEVLRQGMQSHGLGDADFGPLVKIAKVNTELWVRPGFPAELAAVLQHALATLAQGAALQRLTAKYV